MERIIIWLIIILLLKFSNAEDSESDMFSDSGDMEPVDGDKEVVGGEQVDGLEDYIDESFIVKEDAPDLVLATCAITKHENRMTKCITKVN